MATVFAEHKHTFKEEGVTGGTTSNPYLFPGTAIGATVWCTPGTSGKIQYTVDSADSILKAVPDAVWYDWGSGAVAAFTKETLDFEATAVRFEATTGDGDWGVTRL